MALAELVGDADTLLADLAAQSRCMTSDLCRVVGEAMAGESVALSGAEAV